MKVHFIYETGLAESLFRNARLVGSWDENGNLSDQWTGRPMTGEISDTGVPRFSATVELKESYAGGIFRWGVLLDGPGGPNQWGITTELHDRNSRERYREFELREEDQTEAYYLTHCRLLGANKIYPENAGEPAIRFSVWAPNAQAVEMVRGSTDTGYIADDNTGATSKPGEFPLQKDPKTGIWKSDEGLSPPLRSFKKFDHTPYMFRIMKDDGTVAYRTDLYSRCQIGQGDINPLGLPYPGTTKELDGAVSCSVVVDPDQVTRDFNSPFGREVFIPSGEFWADEFSPLRPIPNRIEDLIIYELHVGGLGYGRLDPSGKPAGGTLEDAIQFLDYLVDLGINAVELMPMNEYEGWMDWGYGTSHFFAVEYSGGGRDQYKHFVRECHRRGIAVIQDVVYNHYDLAAERIEWMYDSNSPEKNIYYWYEGHPSDYPEYENRVAREAADNPERKDRDLPGYGGYINNMSTGYAPRYHEEMVRRMFISSAAALALEFHVDGFRVDQTTSIHSYPTRNGDGAAAEDAKIFGAKFLRELTLTLKLIKPGLFLIAEDHSGWSAVTEPVGSGGLGFDSTWYSDFYHNLIGDTGRGPDYACLIKTAGLGDNRPLAMDIFEHMMNRISDRKVVYLESHDEAGNGYGTGRTIAVAVNRAPLYAETRLFAEARCRVACGLTLFSAGVPMFFMGEEVGFEKDYTYNRFVNQREDFFALRSGTGAGLFRYYQDAIRLRQAHKALRSPFADVVHVNNINRVIAFRRWYGEDEFLVVASLNDNPFPGGYVLYGTGLSGKTWKEVMNSDSGVFGGTNTGNFGAFVPSPEGYMNIIIPANTVMVFQKVQPGAS